MPLQLLYLITLTTCTFVRSKDIPKLVVLCFDGFRHDYFSQSSTPNMYQFASQGVLAQNMKSTFVTKTFPNFFSIATGFYQETHGIINTVMFDPEFKETFTRTVSDPKWWDNGLSIPIWLANELSGENRRTFTSMYPVSQYIFRGRQPTYIEIYEQHVPWQGRVNRIVHYLTNASEKANFVMAYFDEPDSTAHQKGPFSEEVKTQVQNVDNIFGYFMDEIKKAEIYDSLNVIVLSDHGMAVINEDRVIRISEMMDVTKYKIYGISPVYNVQPSKGQEEEVYKTFKKLSQTHHFKVYRKEDIPEEYHYKNNRRILPILIEAEEGYDICILESPCFTQKESTETNPCSSRCGKTWGNHGYNNSLKSMQPFFIAGGPSFKKKFVFENTFENINLYPLMVKLLGLDLTKFPSNGTLEMVSEMLEEPGHLRT